MNVHVDDGRAWLERTDRTYDTIIFALPDSLTLIAGSSQVRLESYLFTSEALKASAGGSARRRLRHVQLLPRDWLVDRYSATVAQAFGHAPCVDLVAPRQRGDRRRRRRRSPAVRHPADAPAGPGPRRLSDSSAAPAPVSDDRPFPYLRTPSIP